MNKLLVAMLCAALAACSSQGGQISPYRAFKLVQKNFTYVSEPAGQDQWVVFTHPERPMYGDCEDFVFTLQRMIGGEAWAVKQPSGGWHAVLIHNGRVFDNTNEEPTTKSQWTKAGNEFKYTISVEKATVVDN